MAKGLGDNDSESLDSLRPLALKNVLLCDVPPSLSGSIIDHLIEMGASVSSEIGPNAPSYLVVGRRFGAIYNQVVDNYLPDTVLLSPAMVESVWSNWLSGRERVKPSLAFSAGKLDVFEKLLVCLSGFDNSERAKLTAFIESLGGKVEQLLTRNCDVLVVPKPQGRKYEHARMWGTAIADPLWVHDSIRSQAALDPKRYTFEDALVTAAPAVTATRKRSLAAQSDSWGKITQAPRKKSTTTVLEPENPAPPAPSANKGILSNITFAWYGFNSAQERVVTRILSSNGAQHAPQPHYLLVSSEKPRRPPQIPEGAKVITEWAIERTLHLKQLALDDIWSQPVWTQPIPSFTGLRVCVSGFTTVELRHVQVLLRLLGAKYEEVFTADRDILVANKGARKLSFAVQWRVPAVTVEWLWESAIKGQVQPIREEHALDGRGPRPPPQSTSTTASPSASNSEPEQGENTALTQVGYFDENAAERARLLRQLGEKETPPAPRAPITLPATDLRRRH